MWSRCAIMCARIVGPKAAMGRHIEACIHSLLAIVLLVQIQLIGGSNSQSLDGSPSVAFPSPTPTVTANASVNSSLLQLPRPALPPPPLPDDPPLGPRPLLLGQCAVGAESAQASGLVELADAARLYVDVGRPAECSGIVARWEVCFSDQAAPVTNVQIAVLRPQDSMTYRISSVSELSLDPGDSEAAELVCQYIEATVDVTVEQGDLIGFISSDGIRIGLSTHSSRSLHVYTQSQDGQLSSIGPVQLSQLQQLRQAVAPLIHIVINMTNMSSTVAPSPTETTTPSPTDRTDGRNRTNRILISAVIVAAVVIAILFVVVCVLVCCICKARCKFSKCCNLKKKEKKAPPQQSIPDQSMLYNDLYVPRNPSHIIHNGRRFTAQIHDNPAYGNPGSNAPRISSQVYNPGNDDQQTTSSTPQLQEDHVGSSHSHTRRGLDHTYETIR